MPKYYVDAGDLKKIVDAITPTNAAVIAFKTLEAQPVPSLRNVTIVSEEGFDSVSSDDLCFSTIELLEQSDQIGFYKED